jgi:hypothetical protein
LDNPDVGAKSNRARRWQPKTLAAQYRVFPEGQRGAIETGDPSYAGIGEPPSQALYPEIARAPSKHFSPSC